MKKKAKKFIQNMHMKKGAFSAKAMKAGMSTMAYAQKEKGAPGKLGKQARLAITLVGLRHKKSHKRNKTHAGGKTAY